MGSLLRAGYCAVLFAAFAAAQIPQLPPPPPGAPQRPPIPEPAKPAPSASPAKPAQGQTAPAGQPAGTPAAAAPAAGSPTVYGNISMNGASLREVIDQLARLLKINYILDPKVNGSVTLYTYGEVKDIDTKSLLDLVLRINGMGMVKVGDIYRIAPLADMTHLPMKPENVSKAADVAEDDSPMLNLIFLKYATVEELTKVLEPFIGESARIIAYPPANLLFILDSRRQMRRTLELISTFDSDVLANQRVRLFETRNSRPSELAQDLDRILKSISLNEKNAPVKFLPVDRINTLIAIAPNPGVFDTVATWLEKLDIPLTSSGTAMDNHVYRLRYQRADCLAMVIQQLYGAMYTPYGGGYAGGYGMSPYGGGYGGYGGPGAYGGGYGYGTYGGSGAGAYGMGGYQSIGGASAGLGIGAGCGGSLGMMGGGYGGYGYGGGYGAPGAYGYPGYAPQYGQYGMGPMVTNPMMPAPGGMAQSQAKTDQTGTYLGTQGQQAGSEAMMMPRIVPNTMDNSLLIQATANQYASILKLLRTLDIPPRQILLEAKIYEVTLGNGFSTGLTASFLRDNKGGQNGLLSATLNGGATGITLGQVVHNSQALLNYIVTDNNSRTRLVQSPSLIATDSIPASITVGSEVPIITAQGAGGIQNGGTSQVVQQVAQRTTGVTLNVMAHVNPSGIVTLVVNQEISAPSPSVPGAVSGQSFSKRNVQTQLTMEDGDTIAIGGIILESSDASSAGVPGLHRIPILGAAFGSRQYTKARTELIIFLTPRVIFDNADLQEASDELKTRLKKLKKTVKE